MTNSINKSIIIVFTINDIWTQKYLAPMELTNFGNNYNFVAISQDFQCTFSREMIKDNIIQCNEDCSIHNAEIDILLVHDSLQNDIKNYI